MPTHVRNVTRLAAAALALAALLPLGPAPRAQGSVLLEGAVTRRESADAPTFGGLSLTSYSGPVGLRLGGTAHVRNDGGRYDLRAWTADADILLEPFRPVGVARALLLGFSPYAFVGLGGRGDVYRDAPDTSLATASYGAGVHHQIFGWLGVGAEARYRRALRSDSAITVAPRGHFEYRLALGASFGAGRRRMRSDGALAPAAAMPCAGDCAPRSVERRELAARTVGRVLDAADGLVGTRYAPGGDGPARGFDAAHFVAYVFERAGVQLPPSTSRMLSRGAAVSTGVGSLRPGDLLFFASDGDVADHVGIYVGRDRVVHAIASGGRVRYDILGEGQRGTWLAERLVAARRVVTGDEQRVRARFLFRE